MIPTEDKSYMKRLSKGAVKVENPKDKFESPRELNPKIVQYYCHHTKLLEHNQIHKAIAFLEHKCIVYNKEQKCYLCGPIEGYNTRTYTLKPNKDYPDKFECNCQAFVTQVRKGEGRPFCSHLLALFYHFKIKNWMGGINENQPE